MEQIQKARAEAEKGKRVRGASTISQQTAKNVFLWPGKSYLRKGIEVYFTFLIEWIWGKERIMEVYLNSIEMGNGIYGAEAVAREHFHKNASKLTPEEIRTFCRGKIAGYKIPKKVYIWEELPKNTTGKVCKAEVLKKIEM